MVWQHVYDPLGSQVLSTLVALVPLAVLLGLLACAGWAAQWAALAGLTAALLIAVGMVGMPADAAAAAAVQGAAFGLFPIGWIIVTAMFLYRLCVEAGALEVMKRSVTGLSADHRLQALLIAFCFGAFLEGAAGFGAPVAISAALMTGAGFPPLEAACLALIANTAPVAFGALGTPIITLAKVTGLDEQAISALAGRQLPFFSLIVPAWMVVAMAGWRGLAGAWPAVLTCGATFAAAQFVMANLVGAALVDVVGGAASLAVLAVFLRAWKPKQVWRHGSGWQTHVHAAAAGPADSLRRIAWAWTPWAVLSVAVFCWGLPPVKGVLEGRAAAFAPAAILPRAVVAPEFPVPRLDGRVAKVPPATREPQEIERAVYRFNWLSAAGTGILLAAVLSAPWLGIPWRRAGVLWWHTLRGLAPSLATIAAMLALAFVTRYSGTDVTLGLALTSTGPWYAFCAPLLGWLGVALTGSDTSSNAMFGSLQRVTAEQLGLDPLLTCTANSTGGVMGKMIDAQSIVVSATATGTHRQEGAILRRVFPHSLALAVLMGVLVWLQSGPLAWMVPAGSRRSAQAAAVESPDGQVFQFMFTSSTRWSDGRTGTSTSYLWIPEDCRRVRGLLVLCNNVPEHKLVGHPAIREACAAQDLGIVWSTPSFMNFSEPANSVAFLEQQLAGLAAVSGYEEVATAPLLPLGESLHLKMVNALLDERPERTIAGVLLKNPNLPPQNRVTPVLATFGTAYEWGQKATDIRTAWSTAGAQAYATLLEKRKEHPQWPISYVLDGHSGHFDCDERLIRFVARYIELAVRARLPADGTAALKPVDITAGWSADLPLPGREGRPVVAETGGSGLPWYFDREQAREAQAIAAIDWQARTQLPAYLDEAGQPLPFDFHGIPRLTSLPFEADGITFRIRGTLLDAIPAGFVGAGEPLASGTAAVVPEWICGPIAALGGERFQVAFDRTWLAGHPVYVGLRAAGAPEIRGIVMPAAIDLAGMIKSREAGQPQTIDFDPIADVTAGTRSVALSARSSAGLPVRFFVQAGPAIVKDGTLECTPIPPRSRFPLEVTVHAWQLGTTHGEAVRPAAPVARTFRILAPRE